MNSLRFFPHWAPDDIKQVIGYLNLVNRATSILGHDIHWVEVGGYRGESATIALGFSNIVHLDIVEANEHLAAQLRKRFVKIEHVRIVEALSVDAAALYMDLSVDVVYIDADHKYESVKADITNWLPKIRKGGLICGHDYHSGFAGVVKAVDENFTNKELFCDTSWMSVVE